jgi:adenine-specific DNA-methyltransferase
VLDCFAGSGTTAAVAHKMGRRWVTSEVREETVRRYTLPRLTKVVRGEDDGGISFDTSRAFALDSAGDEVDPPEGVLPDAAQDFASLLARVAEHVEESGVDLDKHTIKALTSAIKTKPVTVRLWRGGGAFTHVVVAPSMYEVDPANGDIFLSDAAVGDRFTRSMAGQLNFALTGRDRVFCGIRGRQLLVVVDGVADDVVVRTVAQHLGEKERAVIVAKVVLPEAEELLAELSTGSRLKKAPRDLFPRKTVK